MRYVMEKTTLYIKNMVCDRCIQAVTDILRSVGLRLLAVELGLAQVESPADGDAMRLLADRLAARGFELLADRKEQTVERIRNAVVEMVHYSSDGRPRNLSAHVAASLGADYSALSRLFSEATGMTIERYFIMQRIERVKELLQYGELSLAQIAWRMNYSSAAYLSTQFKSVVGMTPSQYKAQEANLRRAIDRV